MFVDDEERKELLLWLELASCRYSIDESVELK